jgi:aerobic C4-dicarboxylate transport protein
MLNRFYGAFDTERRSGASDGSDYRTPFQIDRDRVRQVLGGKLPFDEAQLDGVDAHGMSTDTDAVGVQELKDSALTEMEAKGARARARAAQN